MPKQRGRKNDQKVLGQIASQGADQSARTERETEAELAKTDTDKKLEDVEARQAETDAKMKEVDERVNVWIRVIIFAGAFMLVALAATTGTTVWLAIHAVQKADAAREQVYQLQLNDALQDNAIQQLRDEKTKPSHSGEGS